MAISVIIDGFDPWERIEPLLVQTRKEAGKDVEVCLAISYLMDTEADICRKYGTSLFGGKFFCLKTDNLSVLKTRLQAQQLLHGSTFLYLSPFVAPADGTIAALLEHTVQKGISSSAPLGYLYPDGLSERTLAHGFAHDGKRIVNLCAGMPTDKLKNIVGIIANPYCFCSPGSYYKESDKGASFWQSHLNASSRHGHECVSLGSTASGLHEDNFSIWNHLFNSASLSGNDIIAKVAKRNDLKVSLTPYGEYRLRYEDSQPMVSLDQRKKPYPRNKISFWTGIKTGKSSIQKSHEEIFWELLVDPNPDLIAQASAKAPLKPLQRLAQKTLHEIAQVSWEDALAIARRSLNVKDPNWQSLEDWEKMYSDQKTRLYPENEISLWKAIKTGRSIRSSLGIFYQIFKFGLTNSARRNER